MVIPLAAALLACLLFTAFGFLIGRVSQLSTISRLEDEIKKSDYGKVREEAVRENARIDLTRLREIARETRTAGDKVSRQADELERYARHTEETIKSNDG